MSKGDYIVWGFIGTLILIMIGIIWYSYPFETSTSPTEGELIILNTSDKEATNQVFKDYVKDKFDAMDVDRQIEYVDNMYFSTCYEINDFCLNESYSELQGCEYCEGK